MEILKKILENKNFKKSLKFQNFTLKVYEDSDFEGVLRLYNRVFPGYMSQELWLWKNVKNPYGAYYTILMKDKEKVISSYSVAPKIFSINGKSYPCVLSLDTMTDANYRGLGISTYLARLTYEYGKIKGAYFVYGFPNKKSYHLIFNKVGWDYFGKRIFVFKNLSQYKKKPIQIEKEYNIEEINTFGKEVNDLWENYKTIYLVMTVRNSKYLNWRFADNKLVKYNKFYLYDKISKDLNSYFILKRYIDKFGTDICHIVDFLIGTHDISKKKKIFSYIEKFSINNFCSDCDEISFWMPDEDLRDFALNHLGYSLREKKKYFGYKLLRKSKINSILKNSKNWYITMANSDVF